ncbi:MAG: hypothetical protein F9K18_03820 [Thermoanaerobaculia bacterium]|nr:MAG: hypothetical protein F9K18_03820 [Thermoanaerobaculia bacterium]
MTTGNRVVARFRDGRLIKGSTGDFLPTRELFHVHTSSGETVPVRHADLKAVFFVRDFAGDPEHREKNEFAQGQSAPGRRIRVEFQDGEVLVGTTQGYQPNRPGFFIVPADPTSNIERCFVIAASARDVRLL